jgi:cell division protein YceG involved in septum cleavage
MTKRFTSPLFITALVLVLAILAVIVYQNMQQPEATQELSPADQKSATVPADDHTPSIPESNDSAKTYIDRATTEADKKDYDAAIAILQEGITAFPEDMNLQLTLEYYQNEKNEAERNAQ